MFCYLVSREKKKQFNCVQGVRTFLRNRNISIDILYENIHITCSSNNFPKKYQIEKTAQSNFIQRKHHLKVVTLQNLLINNIVYNKINNFFLIPAREKLQFEK